jgi:hypothetical protein
MIDGQQRLTTLVKFANQFPLRKLHRMSSLNHEFFKDLTKQEQEKILDTPIRSIVIDAGVNMDLRYEIFERLNRGSPRFARWIALGQGAGKVESGGCFSDPAGFPVEPLGSQARARAYFTPH